MTDFGQKITFEYKKVIDAETRKVSEFPGITLVLGEGNKSFETTAIIDSGSDTCLIPEWLAEELGLKLGDEDRAEVVGGTHIITRLSKVKMMFKAGKNIINLGHIPVAVGVGMKDKEEKLDIILGRNPIFDMFKITFEQYKKQVTFEKVNPKWRPY